MPFIHTTMNKKKRKIFHYKFSNLIEIKTVTDM